MANGENDEESEVGLTTSENCVASQEKEGLDFVVSGKQMVPTTNLSTSVTGATTNGPSEINETRKRKSFCCKDIKINQNGEQDEMVDISKDFFDAVKSKQCKIIS